MRNRLWVFAAMVVLTLAGSTVVGQPVAALKPHPLDKVFDGAKMAKDVDESIVKSDLYKKAVKAALLAKAKAEDAKRANPKYAGASPGQAARAAFLKVLLEDAE